MSNPETLQFTQNEIALIHQGLDVHLIDRTIMVCSSCDLHFTWLDQFEVQVDNDSCPKCRSGDLGACFFLKSTKATIADGFSASLLAS